MNTTNDVREWLAAEQGYDHGRSVGTWVIDGNTTDEALRAIVAGYDEGDPAVMDMEPSPLSGEWADDPTPTDVLTALGVDDDDSADELLTTYETAFSEGFWGEVLRAANARLGDEV